MVEELDEEEPLQVAVDRKAFRPTETPQVFTEII